MQSINKKIMTWASIQISISDKTYAHYYHRVGDYIKKPNPEFNKKKSDHLIIQPM